MGGKSKVASKKKDKDISWAFGALAAVEFIPEELENQYSEDIEEYYGGFADEYDEFNPCNDEFYWYGSSTAFYPWYDDSNSWRWTRVDWPVSTAFLTGGEGTDMDILTRDQARLFAIREADVALEKARVELVEFDRHEAQIRPVAINDAIDAAACLGEDADKYIFMYDAQVEEKRVGGKTRITCNNSKCNHSGTRECLYYYW
jgi:hypothetical protein